MAAKGSERSNADWVATLQANGSAAQHAAFRELGNYLQRVVCTYIWKRGHALPGLVSLARPEQERLAEEFVQEALITIYQKLNQYSGGGSFLGWATTIALRIAGEELRKAHWHSPRLTFDQDAGSAAASASPPLHPEPADPKAVPLDRHVQLQAILHLIDQALQAECSEQQRRAFLARFVDGHTYDEIAATLNISPSAVYQTIHQARRKLKQRLLEAGYQVEEFL